MQPVITSYPGSYGLPLTGDEVSLLLFLYPTPHFVVVREGGRPLLWSGFGAE